MKTVDKVKMVLTNGFGPDVRVYKEASYLVDIGLDVEVLCWDRQGEFKEFEVVDGIKVRRFFVEARYGTGYRQLFSYLRFIQLCKHYLDGEHYEFLHCHDLDGIIAGWWIGKKDKKLIFDMHEFYEGLGRLRQRFRVLVRAIVSFFQSKSDHIIYVNDIQTRSVKRGNRTKLIFIPNYPDLDNYRGSVKTLSKKLRISYIGGVRQFVQLKKLMDACKDMKDVDVKIHGDGVAYKSLKNVESNYPNVVLTGKYHFTDSAKLYSEADVLYVVYPTTSEQYLTSYPVKLFEAIITKTPPIVGEGTVLEEFVKLHDIGFVVDGDDIQSIKDLVNALRRDQGLIREKEEKLAKIQYNYSWDNVVENLDKIYVR